MNPTWQWWNRGHPQTLKVAVGLSYAQAVFGLLSGFSLLNLLISLAWVLVAVGMANDKRIAWIGGIVLSAIALVLLLLFVLDNPRAFLVAAFSLIWIGALFAALVHPMTREYQKIWFR